MATDLERQLLDLKQGDHICLIYETMAEQMAVAVPFLIEGLIRRERRCLYVAGDQNVEAITQALAAAGVDVAHERDQGSLWMPTKEESYLEDGKFEPQAMIDFLRQAETQALADGFSGVRVVGEMTWALGPEVGSDRLIEFEALFNNSLANSRSIFLCLYNRSRFDSAVIHDVLRTHPIAILGDLVCPNPYYEPPELVLAPDQKASAEFKRKRAAWWIAQLKRARAAEQEHERTLEKLKLSERRLAESQEVAHIGSWERDLRTNAVSWSVELYRLFGLRADEVDLSYQKFLKLLVPEDVDRIRALADEAVRERRRFSCDYRITHADGSVHVLHDRGGVILNAEGEPIRLVGTCQDVTERRRVEETIEENRRRLHMVLATLPVGVAVLDRAADVMLANPAFKHIWSDMIVSGRERWARSKGFWHDSGQRIDPESWASARALSKGETSLNELIDIETFDGQQKTIQASAAPVRNAEEIIVGAVVVIEDVTERVRAQKALRESAERLQHLSRRLLKVQEEERRHLARELHDEFGQILATITLQLHAARTLAGAAALPRLDECATLLKQAGEQVRSLALELRPTMIDTLGLDATLRWLAEQHQQRTGCAVQVKGHLTGLPLSPDLSIACFRVVQEALTNVARHAAARHVWIELRQSESILEVAVRDDGAGFDMAPIQEQAARRGSLGLVGMRERIQILGGSLNVESELGRGTRIRATFPMSEDSEQPAEARE